MDVYVGECDRVARGDASAMKSIEDRFRASGIYTVLVQELGTDAWSQGRRTSLYMVGFRRVLAAGGGVSPDASWCVVRDILQNICLWRAARGPADWDEWAIRPGDSGYSMVLARYASQQVYTEMERSSAEGRAYVNSWYVAQAQTRQF